MGHQDSVTELRAALFEAHRELLALQARFAEAGWIAEALRERTRQLGERTKELECLYRISDCLRMRDGDTDCVLQHIVDAIPMGYQYPEATSAELTVRDRTYRSPCFRPAAMRHDSEIERHGVRTGTIRVFVAQGGAITGLPAILPEERVLLRAIATWIGELLDHRSA